MELTKKDRLILWNQYEILKYLNKENSYDYNIKQDILKNGFQFDYDSLFEWFEDLPTDTSQEVYDILEMFRRLTLSFDKLKDIAQLDRKDYMFKGFDGSNETGHYIYAKWLIEENQKYLEFSEYDLNTQCRMLPKYKVMLERLEEIAKKKGKSKYECDLAIEEMNYIIGK